MKNSTKVFALAIVMILIASACSGIDSANTKYGVELTPTRTINAFCIDLANSDYQQAYSLVGDLGTNKAAAESGFVNEQLSWKMGFMITNSITTGTITGCHLGREVKTYTLQHINYIDYLVTWFSPKGMFAGAVTVSRQSDTVWRVVQSNWDSTTIVPEPSSSGMKIGV